MAFVVFFSTMSFTINMHYCGEILVETTIFSKSEGCEMEMQKPSNKDCSTKKKNCCNEKQISFDGQDELEITFDNLTNDQKMFIVSFVNSFILDEEIAEKEPISLKDYPPPNSVKSIYKFVESYLI